jgi:hypothetical protein
MATKQLNLYELSGDGIQVTYATTSFQGKPLFTYHDAFQFKSASGDEIRTLETDIGTLVTIVLHLTIDRGSTTFSLLLPRVNLPASNIVNITAEGITTLQRFSIPPPQGQTQSYTVRSLQGMASSVVA